MAGLSLQKVRKEFGGTIAVDELDLDIPDGQLTALLGPSGCGKTTLLRMIAGLEEPTSGKILLDGEDITGWPAYRRKFGMVFQSFALFPHLSVAENVAYSLTIAGVVKQKRQDKVSELLDLVQLADLGGRRIGQLSGGQRQRVAIARALAQEPDIFLLDEPMSALDAKLREEMQIELRMLQQKLGITTIVVTHDQREAMTMADNVVVMSHGKAEQVGSPDAIYHQPKTDFVAGFIGKTNFLSGKAANGSIWIGLRELEVTSPLQFMNGSKVLVSCRPETTRIAAKAGQNRLPAKVSFIRNIGSTCEIHLDAGDFQIVVERRYAERGEFQVGQDVFAEIPPEAIRVFPESAGGEAA